MRRLLALPLVLAIVALPVTASAAPQGEQIDGGPAPTQATAVEAGTAYADDVRPGEARWFSLDAETGQRLGATLTEYGDTEYNCCLKIALSDPDFNSIATDNGYNGDGTAQTLRAETDEDGVDESGTYYLSVELDDETAKRPVTYDFSIDVAGEGMLSSSPSPTAEPTSSPTGDASASPTTSTDDASVAAASSQSSDGPGMLLWGVVGVLALLLVVLLALVAVLLRRLGGSRS